MILSRVRNLYRKILRSQFISRQRSSIKNKNITIIAKDCTGGLLLHELGLRFDTPTINACFHAGDFVKFCSDLKYYISSEILEDKDSSAEMGYPVGILGETERAIRVWFMHDYADFTEAKAKWLERCQRIHWDNIYFIMTDGKYCNEELARKFDALPLEHKAFLTYRDIPGVRCAVKLKPLRLAEYGMGAPEVFAFKSRFSCMRVIDDWDYARFLNSK